MTFQWKRSVRHSNDYQTALSLLIAQRTRISMTQAEVAWALGKPQSFVSKYERGERRLDFAETVALCGVLRIDPHSLLSEFLKRKGKTRE